MATVLIHSYSPAPRQGILLNSSPAASPAYHPATLPALVPSNSSLSSSSSSAPGDVSDYFSKSASPSPGPSHGSPAPRHAHLHPTSKPRNGSNHSTVRRIRFAPLPEPRRDDEPESYPAVFDEDDAPHNDHLLAVSSSLVAANCPLPPSVPSSPSMIRKQLPNPHDSLLLQPSYSTSSSSEYSEHTPTVTAPSDCAPDWENVTPGSPSLPALSLTLNLPDSPRKTAKWSKMLNPFKGRSNSLKRTVSREETAAMNGEAQRGRSAALLAAPSSRNSSVSRERGEDFGSPLHRWTSEGGPGAALPLSKKKRHTLFGGSSSGNGVPLGRTQSLTSLSGKDDKKAAAAQKSKLAPPLPTTTNGGRKQQRMLNGRVYGARRNPNANPFANVRTDEPEFVEWGYGGMGSVKTSAGQSSIWSRVQANNDASGLARRSTADDDDDGTGMAWVKRRKEQREREKKEREEREKAEAEAKQKEEQGEEAVAEQPATEGAVEVQPEEHAEVSEPKEEEVVEEKKDAPMPMSPTAVPLPSSAPSTPHVEHITHTINIPAPSARHHHHTHSQSHVHVPHHHGHHHTLSVPSVERRDSGEHTVHATPISSSSPPAETQPPSALPVSASAVPHPHDEGEREHEERESVGSSAASAISTTSEDADDGDVEDSPKDEEEEDEEEEDEQEQSRRLTALGAGVEKIARHHKEEQGAAGTPTGEPSSSS